MIEIFPNQIRLVVSHFYEFCKCSFFRLRDYGEDPFQLKQNKPIGNEPKPARMDCELVPCWKAWGCYWRSMLRIKATCKIADAIVHAACYRSDLMLQDYRLPVMLAMAWRFPYHMSWGRTG